MMKKLVGAFLVSAVLFSCSNDDSDRLTGGTSDTEVRIKASVQDVKSLRVSGPVSSLFIEDLPIGVYAHNGAWLAGATANEINNDAAIVSGMPGHSVAFANGPYFYPSDATPLTFFAYAPYATETAPAGVGVAPFVTHTITGQEDVMWATSTGLKPVNLTAVDPILNFQHQLTQLQFSFQSGTGYPVAGNRVVSLTVKNQPNSLVMNVGDGTFTASGSADFQALSATSQTTGIPITLLPTDALSPVMVVPSVATPSYVFDITVQTLTGATIAYTNVEANITTVKGNAHMITFVFTETAVKATATVADWVPGLAGIVTVL